MYLVQRQYGFTLMVLPSVTLIFSADCSSTRQLVHPACICLGDVECSTSCSDLSPVCYSMVVLKLGAE
jgi:hypothetical protein